MMRNVLDWLENAASCAPHTDACGQSGAYRTWLELWRKAREIGSFLARRIPAQSPVLILMEKSPECVAAMLGAVYANCFYTPLDSSMPEARMRLVVSTLEPRVVLCERRLAETAGRIAEGALVCAAEDVPEEIDETALRERREAQIDCDLLYVLFTSGSTGIPKGVSITHRNVIDFVEWACGALRLPGGCRFASQAPFYFDNSVLDIYGTMRMAGTLCLVPRSDFLFPKRLVETLRRERIDTLFWVPSALAAVANAEVLEPGMLPEMRRVFFCGETMACRVLNRWRAALPEADYVNMYGPTEITDVCTWYRVDRAFADTDSLPIGKPCANTRILLIDGEICVGGTCLSPGYYNAPEKTEEVFVPNPLRPQISERIYRTGDLGAWNERGELLFLGRRDAQIKRNGYRIELGEIEGALNAVEGVLLGCCYYDAARERIVGVYTGEASERTVQAALRKVLPRYMLPDEWHRREELPRTGSGKIDRLQVRREVEDEHSVV
ncbi:MAG: amino acid adenylation domain-containing protein [Eubacteriales bacterium]|nr:amino acid adenylation domain-containing protein [Eubacteriales bacterium]